MDRGIYNPRVIRERIVFTGHVQGVGFRATTRHTAERHALAGWVRNEPDGSVAMEIQGTEPAIEAFLHDLRAHFVRRIAAESHESVEMHPGEESFSILR
jgi:acylphosphatase